MKCVIAVFSLTDEIANFFSHRTDAFRGILSALTLKASDYFWQQLKAFRRCLSLQLTYFHRVLYLCIMKEIENTAIWLLLNFNYLASWSSKWQPIFLHWKLFFPGITAWSCWQDFHKKKKWHSLKKNHLALSNTCCPAIFKSCGEIFIKIHDYEISKILLN